MTLVIGVTGGIASGKSTVMHFFDEKGIPVINADEGAREVVSKGKPALKKIRETFGEDILLLDGTLNRKKMGQSIFSHPEKRKQLNDIIQPYIRDWIAKKIEEEKMKQPFLLGVEIPLLYEEGYESMVDEVLVVSLPFDLQKKRLMHRNQLSEKEAEQRITAQWPMEEKRKRADIVIDNSGTPSETQAYLNRWLTEIRKKE